MGELISVCASVLKSGNNVVLLDAESEETLKNIWDLPEIKSGDILPLDIISSAYPAESLIRAVYSLAKGDYWLITSDLNFLSCEYSEFVSEYTDVEDFVWACKNNISILLDLLIEVSIRSPFKLLIGINLPNSFFEKNQNHLFWKILKYSD